MTFTAKYQGECGFCDEPVEVGDEVDWLRISGGKDVVVHARCPEAVPDAPAPESVCPRCFTVRPCFCD